VEFPGIEFEIPPKTQQGEITTIEGLLKTAAERLAYDQAHRMETNPGLGAAIAGVIVKVCCAGVLSCAQCTVNVSTGCVLCACGHSSPAARDRARHARKHCEPSCCHPASLLQLTDGCFVSLPQLFSCTLQLSELSSGDELPFTVVVDDPSGNSFVENPQAPAKDPCLVSHYYKRTPAQVSAATLAWHRSV
jgi:ZPR1 zinc-finger domain